MIFFLFSFFFYFNFQAKPVLVYVLFGRKKEAWHISAACVDIYPTPPTNPSDMPKIELLCTFVTSTPSPLMWFVADVPSVSKTRKACECIKSSIVATPWTRQVHLLWLTLLNDEEPRKTNRREKNKQFTKQSINFSQNIRVYKNEGNICIFVRPRPKKAGLFLTNQQKHQRWIWNKAYLHHLRIAKA